MNDLRVTEPDPCGYRCRFTEEEHATNDRIRHPFLPPVSGNEGLREARLAVSDAAIAYDDAQRAYAARLAEPKPKEEPNIDDPAVAAEWFRPWDEVEAANLTFRIALAGLRAALAADRSTKP